MSTLRRLARPAASLALRVLGAWRARGYDPSRSVVLACQARGGSTWLAETLAATAGSIHLNEPLHQVTAPRCRQFGFAWYTYLPRGADAPRQAAYLDEVLRGRRLVPGLVATAHLRPAQVFRFRRYVVKFCRANLLLGWLAERFRPPIVLLLRHPCAVVASRLAFGRRHGIGEWLDPARCPTPLPDGLLTDFPHLEPIWQSLGAVEEHLAFWWAVNTFVPLAEPRPYPWLVTTYEWLVQSWPEELDRIFAHLGEEAPEAARQRFAVASISALDAGPPAGDRLAGWRRTLSSAQVARILDVAARVGVTAYDDGLAPSAELATAAGRHGRR